MTYIDLASTLVKRLENTKLVGYLDTGGVPTNGTGHTGPEVRAGVAITQEEADQNLLRDLLKADCRMESVCYPSSLNKLSDHQRAALVSFVFNVGAEPEWTIWKDIYAGNLADVPAQLRRFDKGRIAGKLVTIPGLDNRREAEIAFWSTADINVAAVVARPEGPGTGVDLAPPSHQTVVMETPPTPVPDPPLAKTSLAVKLITVIGGLVTVVRSQAEQIHTIVTPYVGGIKAYQTIDTIALNAVVVASIVGVLIHEYQGGTRKV